MAGAVLLFMELHDGGGGDVSDRLYRLWQIHEEVWRREALDALALALLMRERVRSTRASGDVSLIDEVRALAQEGQNQVLQGHVQFALAIHDRILFDRNKADETFEGIQKQTSIPLMWVLTAIRRAFVMEDEAKARKVLEEAYRESKVRGWVQCEFGVLRAMGDFESKTGRVELARRHFTSALEMPLELMGKAVVLKTRSGLSKLERMCENYEASLALGEEVAYGYAAQGFERSSALVGMWLGQDCLKLGRVEDGYNWFVRSQGIFARLRYDHLEQVAKMYCALAMLGWEGEEHRYRQDAMSVWQEMTERQQHEPRWENSRLFSQALGQLSQALGLHQSKPRVHEDGTRFVTPQGEEVNIRNRKALRQILAHLARTQEPSSPDELLEAGWPDAKLTYESGRNRLRVAISTLRKLGLEGFLHFDEGYCLDAEVIKTAS